MQKWQKEAVIVCGLNQLIRYRNFKQFECRMKLVKNIYWVFCLLFSCIHHYLYTMHNSL